ncbi:uncharacterized protein LOC129602714 isoform X1 [Paramacrobiotus metropolitanus]|uniref:uncharacterized protein LOC129602714 isoform X1 n=1 Tax=Paramacrobiotus metropolitanus TaxID=2943436 RepID=UPI00244628B9|nr:uncharacterized protein LOC129602714 isoform X1 [Paramacrobiotus metropolitanus]
MAIGGISWLAVPAHAASLWIRLARKGIWGIILLLAAHARSARGYDDQEACRFHVVNETTGLYVSHYFMCKAPFPPYCCGTDTFKECCRWTHYVINRFGGGSTGLGVGLLVGLGFVTHCLCDIFAGLPGVPVLCGVAMEPGQRAEYIDTTETSARQRGHVECNKRP